jgi:NAD(P)H-hydrate epimerase
MRNDLETEARSRVPAVRILKRAEVVRLADGAEENSSLLIQRAGYAVAQFCIALCKFRTVCIVCGRGNNGGVGIAAATVLAGIATRVWVLSLAAANKQIFGHDESNVPAYIPILIREETDFDGEAVREALAADLIVDAIVGTGFQPPVRPLVSAAIAAINRASGTVVSVDVPSGVDSDSVEPVRASGGNMVFAHGVIALMAPQPAHVFDDLTSGPIAVSELGTQPAVIDGSERVSVLTGRDVCIAFPRRRSGMMAAEFGHVLIVCGAQGNAGGAALAGLAALKSGAGRVTVACPSSVQMPIAALGAALLTHALPETKGGDLSTAACDQIDDLLPGKQVVIVSRDLATSPYNARFVGRLTARCQVPLIISGSDPVALAAPSGEPAAHGRFRVVCLDTHEAARSLGGLALSGGAEQPQLARSIADMFGACVVLNGSRTAITGPSGETWINLSGNAALAKAGMSEVLVGVIAAALARGSIPDPVSWENPLSAFHAHFLRDLHVAAAVHLHGVATDIACSLLHEHALMPEDVLDALPAAFRACDRQAESGLFYLRA